MSYELIPIDKIHANPWQTRLEEDVDAVDELAKSIKSEGLLQVPVGRRMTNGVVQIAFGHSRFVAWKLAKPGLPFPIDVREMTDKQMATYAIVENSKRRDLSPIEKATALKRYIDDFKVTQVEAGELFGLASQASVSNLLGLLELPAPVQAQVQDGALPERLARQLRPLARIASAQANQIAAAVAKALDGEREDKFNRAMDRALDKVAKRFPYNLSEFWPMDWAPSKEACAAILIQMPALLNGIGTPPACKGCQFLTQREHRSFCLQIACFNAKKELWARAECKRVATKLGIAAAAKGEKVELILGGAYNPNMDWVRRALATKHASLRICPYVPKEYDYDYSRKGTLGSAWVQLCTTDLAALKKATPKEKQEKRAPQSWWQRKQAQRRDHEAMARRFVVAAAPHLCSWLPSKPAEIGLLLELVGTLSVSKFKSRQAAIMADILDTRLGLEHWNFNKPPQTVRKAIVKISQDLRLKLPAGWDAGLIKPAEAAKPAKRGHAKKQK